jgi:hypothetical protein
VESFRDFIPDLLNFFWNPKICFQTIEFWILFARLIQSFLGNFIFGIEIFIPYPRQICSDGLVCIAPSPFLQKTIERGSFGMYPKHTILSVEGLEITNANPVSLSISPKLTISIIERRRNVIHIAHIPVYIYL